VSVDEKWEGASFGSILRRNKLQEATLDESILRIIFVLKSTNSSVKQIEYCSIILQVMELPCLILSNNYSSLLIDSIFRIINSLTK
jgi:hypothetical protein